MRNLKTKTLLLLAPVFSLIISCSDEVKQGSITFSYTNTSTGNARVQETASKILVSIKNSGGELIKDKEEISLYSISGEYISEPLVLGVGNYLLDEFIVLDASNQVLYVAPKSGSALAYLVNTPLAIDFAVQTDQVTNVSPEVISAEGFAGVDFGYTTFGFNVVETFSFLSSVMIYNETAKTFDLSAHNLTVIGDETDTLFTGDKQNNTTLTTIRDGYNNYRLVVSKDGFETNISDLTNAELKNYKNTPLSILLFTNGVNNALLLDGINDYVDLGNIYDDLTLPVTVSVWVNLDPSNNGNIAIFDSQDNLNVYNGITLTMSQQHIGITYGDGLGGNNSAFRRAKSAPIEDTRGQWVNITAIIRGATDMDLFLNGVNKGGVYEGGSNSPMNSNSPDEVAKIGSWFSNNTTYFFKGQLDELRIWNRALSGIEVADIYTKKISASHPGLIGYWPFNETLGNVVLDQSSNGFNGVMNGDVQRVTSGIPALN